LYGVGLAYDVILIAQVGKIATFTAKPEMVQEVVKRTSAPYWKGSGYSHLADISKIRDHSLANEMGTLAYLPSRGVENPGDISIYEEVCPAQLVTGMY
jgi:hypothetical protein